MKTRKRFDGGPMTLGNAAAAQVRLIVWCGDCGHQVELAPAELSQKLGVEFPVPEITRRLRCSQCNGHTVQMVVSGAAR
jgi:hypothetical protein